MIKSLPNRKIPKDWEIIEGDLGDMRIRLTHTPDPGRIPEGWALLSRVAQEEPSTGETNMGEKGKGAGNDNKLDMPITGRELGEYLGGLRRDIKEGDDAVRAEMQEGFALIHKRLDQIARALRVDADPPS